MIPVTRKTNGVAVEINGKTAVIRFLDKSLSFYFTDLLKPILKDELAKALDAGCDRIILSLENIKTIDSLGVGLVLVANNVVAVTEAKLYISNVRPFILKIFDIMRISRHLSVVGTVADAEKAD